MEQRRESVVLELKHRMQGVDQKEAEINHLEVKLGEQEQEQDTGTGDEIREAEGETEGC